MNYIYKSVTSHWTHTLQIHELSLDTLSLAVQMHKAKSNKELWAFLFNDFLLLTHTSKQFTSSGPDKLFSNKNNIQLKMYKPVSEGTPTALHMGGSSGSRLTNTCIPAD